MVASSTPPVPEEQDKPADAPRAPWRALVPWASLALGVLSAALMDRSAQRAWLVVAAIGVGWAGVVAVTVIERHAARSHWLWRVARVSSRLAALGPVQFALFFTLPFYARAWGATVGHSAFIGALALAAALTLWDPWHAAVAARPAGAAALHGAAAFAGLGALLPIFGLSNALSLQLAAGTTALVMPLIAWIALPNPRSFARLVRLAPLLLSPVILLVWPAARRVVPAAPLRLVSGSIGTTLVGYDLPDAATTVHDPGQLVCLTALWAPRGLRDAIVHVWRKDGRLMDRIPVELRGGGREQGFRTYSIKQNLGRSPAGRWSCSVETASGQLLGRRAVVVETTSLAPEESGEREGPPPTDPSSEVEEPPTTEAWSEDP